jgi:hypothetical protein
LDENLPYKEPETQQIAPHKTKPQPGMVGVWKKSCINLYNIINSDWIKFTIIGVIAGIIVALVIWYFGFNKPNI